MTDRDVVHNLTTLAANLASEKLALAERLRRAERERDELRVALERIKVGETTVYDEYEGHDVIVSMDAEELQEVADVALTRLMARSHG